MHLRTTLALFASLALGCGGAAHEEPTTPTTQPSAQSQTSAESPTAASNASPAASSTTPNATSGDPLQRYARDVMAVVSRHWTIPQTIPREEITRLEARIEINIDEAQVPTAARVVQGSGNPVFDASVTRALADLVLANETLPPPPPGLDQYGVVRLRLRGR